MACQTFVSGDVSVSWVPLSERRSTATRPTGAATTASEADR